MSRASALSEDPMDLSHPQRMSKRILSHLLSELKSKLDKPIYRRFSAILNQSQRLEDLMYHCVRIDVLAFVDDGKLYDKRADRLQSLSNRDKSYDDRAIYLHVVEMPAKTQRYYVGQSRKLKQRMADHMDFRYREKNPSLHYYALQRSKSDYFVTLSHVPDADTCERLGIQGDRGKDSYLFLDLLETWCCLMFQTLPEKYLNDFLPHDMPRQGNRGLNLQLPLRNLRKSGFDWPEIRDIWNESSDPLHEEYYSWRSLKFHYSTKEVAEHRERGLEICKKLDGMTSTPLRLTMPSPPATGSNPAYGRLQSEASKQPLSSTPSRTRSSTTSGGNSRGSILVDTGVSKIDRSGHRKRKRNAHSLSGGENLTGRSTIRNLESYFKNAAKP